jgi:hypothetical protein
MNDVTPYAPVLERMVELLGSSDTMTFDSAMSQASTELAVEIPEHMRGPLLISAFKVVAGGRIPGAPDA